LIDKVLELVAQIMGIPLEQVTSASSPESIEQWDSLKHMHLVLAIEEAFGIQLTDEEIVMIKDVQSIVSLVEQRTGGLNV